MSVSRGKAAFSLALLVFLFSFVQGLSIATRKPLWNDEIYTQVQNVEGKSWLQIWKGNFQEGNNSPLFYSVQKAVSLLARYHSQDLSHRDDLRSRIIIRLAPVFFMSLGIALCVGYLSFLYSILIGIFALLLLLTTFTIWAYWAEARPYSMVFCVTVFQSLGLWNAFRLKDSGRAWRPIMFAHVFLALTSSLSAIQIAASGVILWLRGYRKPWQLLVMLGIPLAIAVTYYAVSGRYMFWFAQRGMPMALIKASIPEGRLQAILLFPIILWIWDMKRAVKTSKALWFFQGWVGLTLLGYVLFLAYLWFKQKPPNGFEISNRYFISLLPLGVISMTLLSLEICRRPRFVWGRILAWAIILSLTLPRLIKLFLWARVF